MAFGVAWQSLRLVAGIMVRMRPVRMIDDGLFFWFEMLHGGNSKSGTREAYNGSHAWSGFETSATS
jgi:hypothetical protein